MPTSISPRNRRSPTCDIYRAASTQTFPSPFVNPEIECESSIRRKISIQSNPCCSTILESVYQPDMRRAQSGMNLSNESQRKISVDSCGFPSVSQQRQRKTGLLGVKSLQQEVPTTEHAQVGQQRRRDCEQLKRWPSDNVLNNYANSEQALLFRSRKNSYGSKVCMLRQASAIEPRDILRAKIREAKSMVDINNENYLVKDKPIYDQFFSNHEVYHTVHGGYLHKRVPNQDLPSKYELVCGKNCCVDRTRDVSKVNASQFEGWAYPDSLLPHFASFKTRSWNDLSRYSKDSGFDSLTFSSHQAPDDKFSTTPVNYPIKNLQYWQPKKMQRVRALFFFQGSFELIIWGT